MGGGGGDLILITRIIIMVICSCYGKLRLGNIGHVRCINILTCLQGFQDKIVNLFNTLCLIETWIQRPKQTPNIEVCPESLKALLEYHKSNAGQFKWIGTELKMLIESRLLYSRIKLFHCALSRQFSGHVIITVLGSSPPRPELCVLQKFEKVINLLWLIQKVQF